MAYLNYGTALATARQTVFYSRYHSPNNRLYTEAEVREMREHGPRPNEMRSWWIYEPQGPVPLLPTSPLTARARKELGRLLPF